MEKQQMSISRTHPNFSVRRERFKDDGTYNEVRSLTFQLREFRRVITEAVINLQDSNRLGEGALSSDPDDPAAGYSVIWQSDGTGSGDDGDIMMKVTNSGGTTKTTTLIDFSAI